ncbi:MAG: polysaccharide biosynthesis protein, partial [Solirubrobacterales bacterium]|nr:polysaccharide biosynthesis protein [Solirubrobacterales bacterium]
MTEHSSRPSIRHGVVWTTVAFLAGRMVTFAALLVVTRKVSPGEFGVVAAILAYLAILELVSDLGMRATVVYEQDEGITQRVDVAFTLNIAFAVMLTALGVLLAPLVAAFFGVAGHAWLFRLAAVNLLIGGMGNVHDSLLIRELHFRRRTGPLLMRGVVRGVVTIVLALAGLGATALVVGLLAGSLAWTTMLWALAPQHPRLCLDRGIARSMLSYGLGATALQGLAMIGSKLDVTVIGRVLGSHALGVYALAYRIPELIIESVAWNVSAVAFPALSRSRRDEEQGMVSTTLGLIRWQALYALPASAGLAVLSQPLVYVLFGPAWSAAAGVLVAISVAEMFAITIFPLGDALRALGRQRQFIALQCVVLPLLVVLIIVAAPYGLVAVAWMRVVDIVCFT